MNWKVCRPDADLDFEGLSNVMKADVSNKGQGHRRRLREKFLETGLKGFHDYEVIELLLTLGTPRKDCKEAAKAALARFKTLPGVFEASHRELCSIQGIGPKNLFGVKLIKAAADRYLEKRMVGREPILNSKALYDYLYHLLRDKKKECFMVIFLDARSRVISSKILFEGSLLSSSVYPREVVREALEQKAAALIFAHNHPSGDPAPSSSDISITRRLLFSCRVMGITVHDHIVIGDNHYFSFADQGHIARLNQAYEVQEETHTQ